MKSAWRNLFKHKAYVLINLFGLTLGLSVSMFILLFVRDEFSYDRYLPDYEQLCRIQVSVTTDDGNKDWATTEGFMMPLLVSQFPKIIAGTRIMKLDNQFLLRSDTEQFAQDGFIAVDSTFFQVFPFDFIYGDRRSALSNPHGIVITKEVAKKFFGDINPIGKILTSDHGELTVDGVVNDIPTSSHFHFKIVFPLKAWWKDIDQARGAQAVYTYLRLSNSVSPTEFGTDALKDWYGEYGYLDDNGQATTRSSPAVTLISMPVKDIHLQSHAEKEFEPNGQLQLVYIFIGVGIFLIVIATINYINLSNAIAIKRAKEVAIRKTIGASRRRLFISFIGESYAFTSLSFVLAIIIVVILLPQFNLFTGKQLVWHQLLDSQFMISTFLLWLPLGFLSGLYPATILSSFDPVKALKSGVGTNSSGSLSGYFRKGLIISQFTISTCMIVGAFTIQRQLKFIDSRNIGFNKDNVIVLSLTGDARAKTNILKNEISRIPGVEACAATSVVPGKRVVILSVRIPDLAGTISPEDGSTDGSRSLRVISVDADYVKSLGLTLIDGRDFMENNVADSAGAFILNEAAVREFQLQNPVGRPFEYTFAETPKAGKVIGVVKDFNFASIHSPVEPVMLHIFPPMYSSLCVRLNGGDLQTTIGKLKETWEGVTSFPFSYQFLDTTYDAMYRTERATGQVISTFTVLALVIAALGLFGIVSFFVSRRTKEVGIRKVFGASHRSLVNILSREYVMMAVIGNLIAICPAYLVVNQWLQQFAYRVELSFVSFIVAFMLSEALAFMSIIFVIMRTIRTNPAAILRHE